jgi:DNA-binding transcriptional ArsR family regulator
MDANVSLPAGLIADPARSAMLLMLMDGRAQPAGVLAEAAGLSPQAASHHLARLLEGGLVRVLAQGRHRYYALADASVAEALEALGALAPPVKPLEAPRTSKARALRHARSCYDHLAGQLGVALTDRLVAPGLLQADGDDRYALTDRGRAWFADFGVELERMRPGRRGPAGRCLDWTERRGHLSGPLGAALLRRMFELGWLERRPGGRALAVTPTGQRELKARLGLDAAALASDKLSGGVQADVQHRRRMGQGAH